MTRLTYTPGMTRGYSETLEYQIRGTHKGQAHWANTGPLGATCGECAFLGYWQKRMNAAGDTIATTYRGGCEKFYQLTGKHGALVPASAAACRHFQRKEGGNG
jgi:hypothetical protein